MSRSFCRPHLNSIHSKNVKKIVVAVVNGCIIYPPGNTRELGAETPQEVTNWSKITPLEIPI